MNVFVVSQNAMAADKAQFGTTRAAREPAPPDYEELDCWYACYALDNGRNSASWTPKVSNLQSSQQTAGCDCFYVHPSSATCACTSDY